MPRFHCSVAYFAAASIAASARKMGSGAAFQDNGDDHNQHEHSNKPRPDRRQERISKADPAAIPPLDLSG